MVKLKSGKEIGGDQHIAKSSDVDSDLKGDSVDAEMLELEKTYSHYRGNFLGLLIESYQEQIKHLRSELKQKDDIIFDLIHNIGCTNKPRLDLASHKSEEIPRIENKVLSSAGLCKDVNHSKWNKPTKARAAQNISSCITRPTTTTNRYSVLSDNEWLRDEDLCGSELISYEKDDSQNVRNAMDDSQNVGNVMEKTPKSIRRPNVVTEENPEQNTDSPYRKTPILPTKSRAPNRRSVAILGDSMIKDIKHWDLVKSCPNNKIFLKSFPGADISDMSHYVNPTIKRDPDIVVLHCGTNSLRDEESAEKIASDIADLAAKMKSDENEVVVSSIICRGDNLNEKAEKVNSTLLSLCQGLHLGYLDNSNINQEHLTYKGRFPGLHLNADGTNILFSNLVNSINS